MAWLTRLPSVRAGLERLEPGAEQVALAVAEPARPGRRRPARPSASRIAAGSAARAYSSRAQPRDGPDRPRAAGREDRLVEPVGVDRVVDVVHRVELLRPDARAGRAGASAARRRARPGPARTSPAARRRPRRTRAGCASGHRGASSRTQSMWTHATSVPSASWNSVRRRAQTRRQPTTWVVPTSSAPTGSAPTTATSAARTSQVMPRSAYQARSNPRIAEWYPARSCA